MAPISTRDLTAEAPLSPKGASAKMTESLDRHMPMSKAFNRRNYRQLSIAPNSDHLSAAPASPFGNFDIKTPKRISKASVPSMPIAPCAVTDFILHQVETQPRAFAVHCENEHPITYTELWQLAVDIADKAKFGAGLIVPICMSPSNEFIATILAVLTSGSAYTVLDPDGVPERSRAIVADTGAGFVMVHEQYASMFENSISIEKLQHRRQSVGRYSSGRRGSFAAFPGVSPSDLLYMVYTSGSTGVPKGVLVSHHAASFGIQNLKLGDCRRWLLFFNPAFSAAQRLILSTLGNGGCLCLAQRSRLATALPDVLKNLQITGLGMTPSALSTAITPDNIPSSLEQIMTVGEPLSQRVSDLWASKVQLQVTYALAECPMLNFSRKISRGDDPSCPGRPEGTTHAVILKPDALEMVSFGQPGELCFFGDQLADGYHNRQSETEKKFVVNPVGPGKLLRTGDQAVQRRDGTYQIQGRIDNQIKINGQRLEPQEIATKLSSAVDVEGIVCTGANINDKVALVAVIIPSDGADWSVLVNDLRSQALKSFPAFMVPSYWLRSEAFPKSQNGKIDHKALRALAESVDVNDMLGRDPRDEGRHYQFSDMGGRVRNAWASVLQIKSADIRPSDSFIALGGSSLDAINVIQAMREDGVHIELADMLQGQDVEKVAALAQSRRELPAAKPVGRFACLQNDQLYDELVADPGVIDAFPLTALQEGILASTIQGNLDYLYQRVFSVGHLDLVKLRLAFESVFNKSDILKSTFAYGTKGIVQVLRHDFSLPWTEHSRSLDDYLKDDKEAGVTFGEPFFRVALLRQETLVVSVHHSLFDYWSHGFVFQDVAAAFSGGDPSTRPPWRAFAEFIHTRSFEESQQFWATFLADATPTILNHAPTEISNSVDCKIPHVPKSALAHMEIPSSAVIYGAWALVLSAHLASDTVAMGVAISGRELPLHDVEKLDGPTLAMVPHVIKVGSDLSLEKVVQAANKNMWNITKHSQHGIRNAMAASGHQNIDLFDTMVNIHVRGETETSYVKDIFKPAGPQSPWTTEYLTLNIDESSEGINVQLTGEIEKCRLEFILGQFCRAVDLIVSSSDTRVKDISLMSAEELDFVHLPIEQPDGNKTLLGEFEAAAKQYPSRIALNFRNQELLTYSGLNDKAARMADYLAYKGIRGGDIIPILLEKSPFMIITILALFKVGAAYVALDPENPLERNLFITRELGSCLVLTETKHMRYFASENLSILLMDRANLSAPPSDRGHVGVHPTSLAYIVFTSGSTGKPKGVVISHGACATAISSILEYENKRGKSFKALQFSNYIFDASVYDFFVTLHSGGTLCVAPEEQLLDDLAGTINLMGVTHMFMTPTVARLLDPADVPSLESITVGGEQVTNDVVSKWGVAVALRLAYGPTETSVMVSLKDVDAKTQGSNIGRPLPSVGAIILEANGDRPVPYGGVGELCLLGPQLSEGYINARELTTAAFIERHPSVNGQRLYRSGDLARYMPGGEIECLGRKDHQVKINGHRIELGEIENALLRTGVVKDCILMAWSQNSTSYLVAITLFKSAQKEGDWSFLSMDEVSNAAEEAKNKLSDLAHYMMPSFILPISSFPRLPSGKTDRKKVNAAVKLMSLSELKQFSFDKIGMSGDSEVIGIVTPEQALLKEAWIEILSISDHNFGLEANFLSLGGDSISAINLVSCLRRKGLTISVRDVQKNPMLGGMSTKLVRNKEQIAQQVVEFNPSSDLKSLIATTGLQEGSYKYIYPCLPGQSEFLTQGARPESYWCLMATRSLGLKLKPEHWVDLTAKLTETNDILRTTFIRSRGNWYGVVLNDTTPVVDYYDVSGPEHRAQILDEIWNKKFTFGQPYIRYAVLRFANGESQVVTKMDHGLYDGTLLRVLGAHFQDYQNNKRPEIATTFHDLALHNWHTNQTQPTFDFWKQQDRRPTPFQYPNQRQPQTNAHAFRVIHLDFDEFTRTSGVTVAIIFQTVFQMWLSLRSGESNVAFDYLYTGRNVDLPDPQNINGPCANFLPMRYEVDEKASARDLLERTSDDFWLYTENGSVGLEDILRACGFSREKYLNQILFLFQPFEPPTGVESTSQEWVVLPKSEVRIPQPYSIVCEVKKTADANGYRFSFTYDDRVWSSEDIEEEITAIEKMLTHLMKNPTATVGDVLKQGD